MISNYLLHAARMCICVKVRLITYDQWTLLACLLNSLLLNFMNTVISFQQTDFKTQLILILINWFVSLLILIN